VSECRQRCDVEALSIDGKPFHALAAAKWQGMDGRQPVFNDEPSKQLAGGWLVGGGLTSLLTQNRSYRACKFVGIFQRVGGMHCLNEA